MKRLGIFLLGVLFLPFVVHPAVAADFYAGKTIEVVVPFREGGGTDVWMRVMAPYLQKHIAGLSPPGPAARTKRSSMSRSSMLRAAVTGIMAR